MLDVYSTADEIAAARPEIAVLAVGAIEQHSRHLPLGTDWLAVSELARRVAAELDAYWLPALPFSMSQCHGPMPGTVWLRPETLAAVLRELVLSLAQTGIRKFVVLNGHGGNFVLEAVIQELNLANPGLQVIMPPEGLRAQDQTPIFETPGDFHAGEVETSIQLYLNPQDVKEERVDYFPPFGPVEVTRETLDYLYMQHFSPDGVWGKPSVATAAKGEKALARRVELVVKHVQEVLDTLDERKGRREVRR